MLDADAEAQGAHAQGIGELLVELLEDQVHPAVIAAVERRQLGRHIAALAPGEGGEVGVVGDAEVVEGGEQALIEGGPEAQLGGHAPIEPGQDVEPIGSLGGGSEAEQQQGRQVIEPAPVAGGGGVVELIDDHHLVGSRIDGAQLQLGERLHRGEHVPPIAGLLPVDQQLPAGAIAQHLSKGEQGLLQSGTETPG